MIEETLCAVQTGKPAMTTEVSDAVAEAMEAIRKRKETEDAKSRVLDERIKNANVLIAVPAYGGAIQAACVNTLIGFERFLAEKGIEHEFRFITNEALITRARNFLANAAAFGTSTSGKSFSHLLFIDADIACDPADAWKMLQADVPIVGLPCARKQIVWQTVAEAAQRNIPVEQLPKFVGNPCFNVSGPFDVNSVAQVQDIGTGCMLIQTEVLQKLASLHPEWKYKLLPTEQKLGRDWNYDFFKVGVCPATKVYLSEDYNFVQEAQKAGFKTFMLPSAVTQHIGHYSYEMNVPAIAYSGVRGPRSA